MTTVTAHEIGLVGETLNLVGAFILALDLFQRPSARRDAEKLRKLRELGRAFDLKRTTYAKLNICSPDFDDAISDQRSTRLAVIGVSIMALGFLCLMAYHGIEIRLYHLTR